MIEYLKANYEMVVTLFCIFGIITTLISEGIINLYIKDRKFPIVNIIVIVFTIILVANLITFTYVNYLENRDERVLEFIDDYNEYEEVLNERNSLKEDKSNLESENQKLKGRIEELESLKNSLYEEIDSLEEEVRKVKENNDLEVVKNVNYGSENNQGSHRLIIRVGNTTYRYVY